MSKAHDKQIRFVMMALEKKLTEDVELAAIWFRDNKGWKVTKEVALERFARWVAK